MQALIIFAATVPALANVRDHLMPNYLPNPITCPGGCANWADAGVDPVEQARLDGCWQNGTPPKDAANACAMPGGSAGRDLGDGIYIDLVVNSFAGPWCYCATPAPDSDAEQYCYPGPKTLNNPEQINLQMAKEDVIVVSFVTREESSAFGLDRYTADHQDNSRYLALLQSPQYSGTSRLRASFHQICRSYAQYQIQISGQVWQQRRTFFRMVEFP